MSFRLTPSFTQKIHKLFTSQKYNRCAQSASSPCPSPIVDTRHSATPSTSEIELAGTQSISCNRPGSPVQHRESGKQRPVFLAQISCNMKDVRKQTTASAPNPIPGTPALRPVNRNFEDDPALDAAIFSKTPAPRQPESPEEESFRSFLKHQLPRHKASDALSQKIQNRLHQELKNT